MTKYMAAGAFQDLTAESRRSRTPQLARGPRGLRPRTAASSTASRTTPARASSRTAPTCSRRPGVRCRRASPQFTADAKKLAAKNTAKSFSPVYIAGHRLVRRDELRLRLRRPDREPASAASGRARSTRRRRSPGSPRTRTSSRPPRGRARRRRDEAEAVRRVRPGPGRLDGRPGLVQLLRRRQVQERHRRSS